MKYKIDWLKYILWKFRHYQETWEYIFKKRSLYSVAYEIRREAKYCFFYPFLDLIFLGTKYIIDSYVYLIEHLLLSGSMEIIE